MTETFEPPYSIDIDTFAANSLTATIATSVTAVANNSTDETVYPTFVDGATGTQGLETDTGLTYNPSTGVLTSTTFTGALSGTASTATVGTNVTVSANNSTDETVYPTFVDGATGTQGIETDTGLTYNPSTGLLTAGAFSGPLTGNVTGNASGSSGSCTGNAATATVGTSVTVSANNSTDETVYPTFVDGATGSQGIETDTGLTYNPSTGLLTAAGFSGPLTGAVTGTASVATVATNTTVVADATDATRYPTFVGSTSGDLGAMADAGITYNPNTNVLTTTTFVGALTGNVTGNTSGSSGSCTGTAAVATAVTASANNSTDETVYPTFVDGATGSQGIETDTGLTYNPSSGLLTAAAFSGPLTGNVTGNASGSSGSCTGNAATATALASARTIGGVSFDGTGNINLPGVNTSGNQDTSGTAADATVLETARNINGVSFNGSANITVTAAAGTVTGSTLNSGVTASSLTSVGTLTGLSVSANPSFTNASADSNISLSGAGTGYTQASIHLSSTDDARGQGIYGFNAYNDTTWFWGQPYGYEDQFNVHRKASTTSLSVAAADVTNKLMYIASDGDMWIAGTLTEASDSRLKENIADVSLGLSFINSLRPREYKRVAGTRKHMGFIAQEVAAALSDSSGTALWINERVDIAGPGESANIVETQGLRYTQFIAPLVKAVQELTTRIETLEAA